ncbi:MAG TPA: S-layer homology domain-containing protein [Clostridia bacterium]
MSFPKKVIASTICIVTIVMSSFAYAQTLASFSDVPSDHWAAKYIYEMVKSNYLSGYPDGMFRPEKQVTRAEFASMMIKVTGKTPTKQATSTFGDISVDDWYCPYVEGAKYYLTGYKKPDGTLDYLPNRPATREDIAVAVVKLKGHDGDVADESILEAMFTDEESISNGTRKYVAIAVENKLMAGYTEGTFKPQNSISRAEAAAILWRAIQAADGNKTAAVETKPFYTEVNQTYGNNADNAPSQQGNTTKNDSSSAPATTDNSTTNSDDTLKQKIVQALSNGLANYSQLSKATQTLMVKKLFDLMKSGESVNNSTDIFPQSIIDEIAKTPDKSGNLVGYADSLSNILSTLGIKRIN